MKSKIMPNPNLTRHWNNLRYHKEQLRLWHSNARTIVNAAGRRSGKTDIADRKTIIRSFMNVAWPDPKYGIFAPTYSQVKRVHWARFKQLLPRYMIARISESEMTIKLITGQEFIFGGLDSAERFEGLAFDGVLIDETDELKKDVIESTIYPALSDRQGWLHVIGRPKGRAKLYEYSIKASDDSYRDWDYFHWKSSTVLPKEEIDRAKRDLDPLLFQQEYEAAFINFQGLAYHSFDREIHCFKKLHYQPKRDLIFTFDFNISPGTANVLQEQIYKGKRTYMSTEFTACIDEVHIAQNSTTPKICFELIKRYGTHEGNVYVYGDATGGAAGTAKVFGSDWDLVRECLRKTFGKRLKMRINKGNPRERVRLNAFNSRLRSMDGTVRFLLDVKKCPHTLGDFEGVTVKKDGSGELDKKADPKLTHHTDGVGYFIEKVHPITAKYLSDVSYGM